MFVGIGPNEEPIPILLCLKCYNEAFSRESWMKLFGAHPETSGADDSSNACFDGELSYTIEKMGAADYPQKRGPILRLKYPVRDLLESTSCGLCGILRDLDKEQRLLTDQHETAGADLQLFWPNYRSSETFQPFLLNVSLRFTRAHEKDWSNSTLFAVTPDRSSDGEVSHNDREETEALPDVYGLERLWRWMQECERGHPQCALSAPSRLPMRVLDVSGSSDASRVKLLETLDRPCGRYIALSYCWGKKPGICLVQATRNDFMGGIAMEKLPQTLRDAVRVTRSLDIQYLWIDALCICQDSESDKQMQIPYMNEYYRGAVAVISASGAADVHAGFLQPQETKSSLLARVEAYTVAHHPHFGPVPHRIPCFTPEDDGLVLITLDTKPRLYDYDKEPINKRGWTLQESALARRLLTFPSTGGLIMRCLDGKRLAGEILSNPFHEDPAFAYLDTRDRSPLWEAELFQHWTRIVQDYSRRCLSYPGDILVAIGALALESQIRDGVMLGRYVAGLWTNTLRKGLLWHVASPPHPDQKSFLPPARTDSQYHAPSWSWASCGQSVTFRAEREPDVSLGNYEKEEPSWCLEILHCKVFPRSERNPLGAVETGYIDIKGVLIPIRRVSQSRKSKPDEPTVEDVALLTPGRKYKVHESDLLAPDSLDSLALIDSSCYWLPIYYATRARYRGLIVREIIPGRFCRLAFAEFKLASSILEQAEKREIRLD